MRIFRAVAAFRDFVVDFPKRDFAFIAELRDFRSESKERRFGVHNQDHIHTNVWRWGDTTLILSEIQGTFGDFD